MFDKIRKMLSELLKIDQESITPESRIVQDLGADSLDSLQLLLTLEEEFGIRIPDTDYAGFETVGDVVKYLEKE